MLGSSDMSQVNPGTDRRANTWVSGTLVRWFATLLLLIPVGCRQGTRKVALLTPTTGVIIWDGVHTGSVIQGRSCGLEIRYNGPSREDDLRFQLLLLERAAKLHQSAIVVAPIQLEAFRDPIERISQGGTPVVVIGGDLGIRNKNVTYVMTDNHAAGVMAADRLADALHGKGRIAVMGLDFGQTAVVERERALEQELSARSADLHVVERRSGSINLYEEQEIATEILESSMHVDAIVALTASSTRGAFYALKATHSSPSHLLIGFDQDLLLPLADHEIDAVVGVRANEVGLLVSNLICEHIDGKPWRDVYTVPPVLLTPQIIGEREVEQQLHGGGWWKGEH